MNPPWLSRLSIAVLAVILAACATPPSSAGKRAASGKVPAVSPRTADPSSGQTGRPSPRLAAAADCIQGGVQKWGIPADYLVREGTAEGGIVLTLVNPHSGKRGLTIALTPDGRHTEANLDDNGAVVSAQWRGLVSRCADGA